MENVTLQPQDTVSMNHKPCFSVPFDRDVDFVDRPDIMMWLKERYNHPGGRIALVGMGGFGY
jgi:hypothetical protein